MNKVDKEKTTFILNRGRYYCQVMPFSLRNAEATYQRLVNRMFKKQIGWTMEVYVDHLLVEQGPHSTPDRLKRVLYSTPPISVETKSSEVCIRHGLSEGFRVHRVRERN